MEMLKQSTTLAVVGQLDAASSTDQLTAITKSYNVAVEDTSQIVDKLVAVDLNYAASTGEISTALQKVASSAGQAGVGLDKLIGLITISEEKTRQAPEVIGSAWQSIISRISKITAKVDLDDLVDEQGITHTINDADKVLSKYGITLVDTNGKMREIGTVLDEIGAKWNNMSTLEQNQLAYVVAGSISAGVKRT
nr:MAG TPA: minor tail protein [Caudoviricetes sp.]